LTGGGWQFAAAGLHSIDCTIFLARRNHIKTERFFRAPGTGKIPLAFSTME